MIQLTRAPDKALSPEVGILAVAALYFLCRPLVGFLWHDGMFYAVQALLRVEGWPLGDDLFLRYGNQAKYSMLPAIYARLIESFGLMGANIRLLVISVVLWVVALWVLIRTLFPDVQHRVLAFGLVIALAPHYGNGVLSYGETFLTGRILAEAMGMLAISSLTKGRPILGLGALPIAALVHPLVALGAAGIWLAFVLGHPLRFITALAFVVLLFGGLGLADAGPFAWLFETHGPQWKEHLHRYESLGFVSSWDYRLFVVPAVPVIVLLLTARDELRQVRRLSNATLLVAATGLLLSVIGAELLNNRLLTAMQLWRALGWVALLGNLLALRLLVSERIASRTKALLLVVFSVNILEHFLDVMPAFSASLAVLAFCYHLADRPKHVWLFVRGAVQLGAVLVLIGFGTLMALKLQSEGSAAVFAIVRFLVVLLVLTAVLRWEDVPGAIACGAVLGLAIAFYDARTPWQHFVDSGSVVPHTLAERLDRQEVYWEDGLPLLWFGLAQPQYYSCNQKAGTLFYERQAIEFDRRAAVLRHLGTSDFDPDKARFCPSAPREATRNLVMPDQLRRACASLPRLDVIILNARVPGIDAPSWGIPEARPLREVFLYDCSELRAKPDQSGNS